MSKPGSSNNDQTKMSDLPPFAFEWARQWKEAAPRLQAIRDEELRRMGHGVKGHSSGYRIYDKYPERHGMVIMQQWLMRRYLISKIHSKTDEVDELDERG
jgi:hypothetical protein